MGNLWEPAIQFSGTHVENFSCFIAMHVVYQI